MAAYRPQRTHRTPTGECQNPACMNEFEKGDTRLFCDRACADAGAKHGS